MQEYGGYGPDPLRQWLAGRPKPRNKMAELSHWVAQRLIDDTDMRRAWPELERVGLESMPLRALVENAIRNTRAEIDKPTPTEAKRQLDAVERSIHQLCAAIKASPLPANTGDLVELRHGDMSPVYLNMGWYDMNPEVDWTHHPVSVVDTLEFALEMLKRYRDGQPARAVVRHVKHPIQTAFVRHLGWLIRKEYGSYLPGTIARIANAICSDFDPLDKEAVKGILKNTPAPFLRFKKRG